MTKDFRGSNAAAKAWLRGGFRAPKQTVPPKAQKSSFYTVHKAMLRNRSQMLRAARWGWYLSKICLSQP